MKKLLLYLTCASLIISFTACKVSPKDEEQAETLYAGEQLEQQNDTIKLEEGEKGDQQQLSYNIETEGLDEIQADVVIQENDEVKLGESEETETDQVAEDTENIENVIPPDDTPPISEYTDDDFTIESYDLDDYEVKEWYEVEWPEDWPNLPSYTVDKLIKEITDNGGIVVRGVKKGKSTQYVPKDYSDNWYSETPFEILEVYGGDANVGDTVLMYEKAFAQDSSNEIYTFVPHSASSLPIKKNTEYIVFMSLSKAYSRNDRTVYIPFEHSIGRIGRGCYEITEQIKNAKNIDQANITDDFEKDVFDRYYFK